MTSASSGSASSSLAAQYAGNWRFTWHIVDNKAKEKLRKLKTLEGIFVTENARMLWGANPHFCEQFEDCASTTPDPHGRWVFETKRPCLSP